jgi:hypothetical protein
MQGKVSLYTHSPPDLLSTRMAAFSMQKWTQLRGSTLPNVQAELDAVRHLGSPPPLSKYPPSLHASCHATEEQAKLPNIPMLEQAPNYSLEPQIVQFI